MVPAPARILQSSFHCQAETHHFQDVGSLLIVLFKVAAQKEARPVKRSTWPITLTWIFSSSCKKLRKWKEQPENWRQTSPRPTAKSKEDIISAHFPWFTCVCWFPSRQSPIPFTPDLSLEHSPHLLPRKSSLCASYWESIRPGVGNLFFC